MEGRVRLGFVRGKGDNVGDEYHELNARASS
jgi:hypothetical protein